MISPALQIIKFERIGELRFEFRITVRDRSRVGDILERIELTAEWATNATSIINLQLIVMREGVR